MRGGESDSEGQNPITRHNNTQAAQRDEAQSSGQRRLHSSTAWHQRMNMRTDTA